MIDAIITVRAASTRLPGKCFLDLGGKTVLEHVILRCQTYGLSPVVSTTYDDNRIIDTCRHLGIRWYAGSIDDKLERWYQTCILHRLDRFVTIDCDDPLFDVSLVEAGFVMLDGCDVVSPNMDAYLGSNGWALRTTALHDICKTKVSTSTEMIWKHLSPTLNVVQLQTRCDTIEKDLRLTLDYDEDYWLLSTVVRELGPMCSRESIVAFFRANPGLRRINDFRNEQWKLKQQSG